ncbi:MAG: lysophospholipid acyltransferase family protein [Lentisphaeria bacterium]|nr:lysophospholipid acyltransferase family protein [Lentisphaeria bacterium]
MSQAKRKKNKSRIVVWLEYFFFSILCRILELLPMRRASALAAGLTRLLFYADLRHARRTVRHIMYAGVESDPRKAKKMAVASFGEFGKLLAEIVKMPQMYSLDRVRISAPENTLDIISPERNPGSRQIILAVAHYGNWEMAGTAFAEYTGTPMSSLMRPFGNPLIGKKILSNRGGKSHELIDKNQGLRPILRAMNEGRIITVLVDQHAMSGEGVEVEFFGHPARMHMTPALLHLKSGIPIIPEVTRRVSDDFEFEFVFGEPIVHKPTGDKKRDIYEITQRIADELEELIRRDPVQWLWAPRHWLSIERRNCASYADWKRPVFGNESAEHAEKEER